MHSPCTEVSEEPAQTLYDPGPFHHLPGGSWGLAEVCGVTDGASKVILDSGAGRFTEARWEVAWVWLYPGAGAFPTVMSGGMSASLIMLPCLEEASRVSSV